MDYSKNVPNKCNHCKYYTNKDILVVETSAMVAQTIVKM